MLNDPGQREREARKSPIGPPVALWAVPVAVPVWATATLWGALNLPPVVATSNLQAPPVVGWTLAASPLADSPTVKRSGPPFVTMPYSTGKVQ
jgi:hypothetical protein